MRLASLCLALFLLSTTPPVASAQNSAAGSIGIFVDQTGADCNIVDSAPGLLNTYLVHVNTTGSTASQFKIGTSGDAGLPSFISFTAQPPNLYNPNPDLFTDAALAYTSCQTGPWLLGTIAWFGNGTAPSCSWIEVQPANGQPSVLAADCAQNSQFHDPPPTGGRAVFNSDGTCDCTVVELEQTFTTVPPGLTISVDGSDVTTPYDRSFSPGSIIEINAPALQVDESSGTSYAFDRWSDGGADTHTVVIPEGRITYIAYYATVVEISFDTSPSGLPLVVNSDELATPALFSWATGDTHTIEAPATVAVGNDSLYNFESWSDGGTRQHDIVVSGDIAEYIAAYSLLVKSPHIFEVEDVPNDQDRLITLSWQKSGYDVDGSNPGIVDYLVYRESAPTRYGIDTGAATTAYVGMPAASAVPGWELVAGIPASSAPTYSIIAQAFEDSSALNPSPKQTPFFIRARSTTSGQFFDSPADSGYSIDDVAPLPPVPVNVSYNTPSGNILNWRIPSAPDFASVIIHRGPDDGFVPGPGTIVHFAPASDSMWIDSIAKGYKYRYKFVSVDQVGNQSDPVFDDVPSDVPHLGGSGVALHQNVPNPFNPTTAIRFELPRSDDAWLAVYDVSGSLVAVLVDEFLAEGEHTAAWDGRSRAGARVGSGVYFYRLQTSNGTVTKKMVLLK